MKGLLIKDLYMMKKYCRMYLVICVVFTAISVVGEQNTFFMFYPCMLAGMIPVTLLGYDERSKWDVYSGTLPYTRTQIVSAKYIIGLTLQVAVIALTGVAQAVRMTSQGDFSLKVFAVLMLTVIAVSMLASSISLPFMFKYGVERGRMAYYVMIGAVCAAGALGTDAINSGAILTEAFGSVIPLAALFGVLLYALSWKLAAVFYNGRE